MNFDIGALGASVCAFACVCMGGIGLILFLMVRVLGFGMLPLIVEFAGGLLGGGDDEPEKRSANRGQSVTAQSAAQSLRERARSSSFDDALQRQGGSIPPATAVPFQAASQSIQPGLSPQRPTQGGFNRQQPSQGGFNASAAPRPGLSSRQPLSGRRSGLNPSPQAQFPPQQQSAQSQQNPLGGNLPSLSPRSPAQPSSGGGDEYRPPLRRGGRSPGDDRASGGLGNRDSRRRDNNTIYDDSDDDGLFEFFNM
ncbi:MAG: hypothetical protein ACPG7F_02805 [Aggregatilineales bacterium]